MTMLPIYAGQLIHNQGVKFQIILARIYNTMIVIGEIISDNITWKVLTTLGSSRW